LSSRMRLVELPDVHLVVFMTAGMSLVAWDQLGTLEREVELYRRLRPHLGRITLVTYGNRGDQSFEDRLPGIEIVCNRWGLPSRAYRWLITRVHARSWPGAVVVKSNQTLGADVALRAARAASGAFVARCGYMLSEFTARASGAESGEAVAHAALEDVVFRAADQCVVTTAAMAAMIRARGVDAARVQVVPNYVDTDWLAPDRGARRPDRVGFVGRLDDQKNLFALVEAMRGLDAELWIAGDGPHAAALQKRVAETGGRATFLGRLPHRDLRDMLNSCTIFVLPSLYEGHPKALLEAMSCELPVIGTDVPGIREVLRDQETGWLCGTSSSDLAAAIQKLLADAELRNRLGRAARIEIVRSCGLDRVVDLELSVLARAARGRSPIGAEHPPPRLTARRHSE
jgi:glycosyltransferase involved in cell wall biosynthesis